MGAIISGHHEYRTSEADGRRIENRKGAEGRRGRKSGRREN